MPFRSCYPRVGSLSDPDLCCSCVGRSSPVSRRACARTQRACPRPEDRPPPTTHVVSHPSSYPAARPGMTHRDERNVRRRIKPLPDDFLTDLANANKPRNTIRAYRGDLIGFAAHHDGEIAGLSATPIRAFLGEVAGQAPATRKRKRAAVASFCKWAVRHELLEASPIDRIDAIEVPRMLPRPAAAGDVAAVLGAICSRRPRKDVPTGVLRDRVLFETAYVCGARASEVCGMYVEDLDLRLDDEHARVHGKGGTVRTVLLDDRGYVALLRLYLARSGYTSGPLFRASINGRGGPLSYDAAHNRWKKYCAAAGAEIGIHQLRHAHATELKVSGVAAAASFSRSGERTLPAVQRAALGQARSHDGPGTIRDLGRHHPVASGRTMMQPVRLQRMHA
jgi:integrase/recombinase XerD